MNADASANYSKADRELNAAYGSVMAKATPSGGTRLRTAQRAWLAFRNANCQAMTGSRNGSAYPMLHAMCMTEMTEARTAELTSQLKCQEGDLSCGGPFEP
jgi:uncharacterized protein YecT (DUF1311 family)